MKPEPPKESLFDRTRRELNELGVLNGVSEASVTQPSHRISNNSQFTGIIAKTQRKPTIRQQPIKPSFFTRYKHFQKMPQLPFDVVSKNLAFLHFLALCTNIFKVWGCRGAVPQRTEWSEVEARKQPKFQGGRSRGCRCQLTKGIHQKLRTEGSVVANHDSRLQGPSGQEQVCFPKRL